MKWMTAILIGAVIGMILPMAFGGSGGAWMHSSFSWGTIRPFSQQPNLLFSVPAFLIAAIGFRWFFSWHKG